MNTNHAGGDVRDKHAEVEELLREIEAIRADVLAQAALPHGRFDELDGNYRASARNLLHYLTLRRRDLRPLQKRLAALGLSSLGRAEPHVLATLDAVLSALHRLAGRGEPPSIEAPLVDFDAGQRLLSEHTDALLGVAREGRKVRIMVTMPREAADDPTLIHHLLERGMDCMRINCAHDDAPTWARMIGHLRQAERALGASCRIAMDLGGPKLRTGPLEPGPKVVRARPHRDDFGRVTAPARIWLTSEETPLPPPAPADATLRLPPAWLSGLRVRTRIKFRDARGARRALTISEVTDRGSWAEATKTAYFTPGILLFHDDKTRPAKDREASLGDLPPKEGAIELAQGDSLILTRDQQPGRAALVGDDGKLKEPASIGCTIPEVFDDVRSGDAIWFDDGKIGGIVETIDESQVLVRVTHARSGGAKLRADKGINLPESPLKLPALTQKDMDDLDFVGRNADIIELSFANSAADVRSLQEQLAPLGDSKPAIVLKIETRRGFANLPEMLFTAMRSARVGVMIARGDLGVEAGFERMAEVQEEMLWVCEAAHIPIIWATQVLESLAKEGMPSRAEITDAAMGNRAECVMLNKGPHVIEAVRVLDDILRRMEAHQAKKRAMLRELRLAHHLLDFASAERPTT